MTTYESMVALAGTANLPKHFVEDLTVHDKAFMEKEDRPENFGWIIRECGTNLAVAGSAWGECQIDYHASSWENGKAKYFMIIGSEIHETSPQEMMQWWKEETAEQYAAPIIESARRFAAEYRCKVYIMRIFDSNKPGGFRYSHTTDRYLQRNKVRGWQIADTI